MHVLVSLSPHGFGHIVQTAPIVNSLRKRLPTLRLTLRSTTPREFLATRFDGEFDYIEEAVDFGMRMVDAVEVAATESADAYATLHAQWEEKIHHEAACLRSIAPDLIIANAPYLTLAAAATLNIPAVALSSLNWADIYAPYCLNDSRSAAIVAQMRSAYNSAACFIQTQPSMPMEWLPRRMPVGPVARLGVNRRAEISQQLQLRPTERLAVIGLGGIAMRLPVEQWPRNAGIRYIVPSEWQAEHPDCVPISALSMPFIDLLTSCDVLITKPGYGSFTEAACNNVPVLYVSRGDWPEEPYLVEWLIQQGRCVQVSRRQLETGQLAESIDKVMALPAIQPPQPYGIEQTVTWLMQQFADVLRTNQRK